MLASGIREEKNNENMRPKPENKSTKTYEDQEQTGLSDRNTQARGEG
jgi:hypothetical protein